MIEIKQFSSMWSAPGSSVIPSENLSANDKKKLAERQALIERLREEINNDFYWLKINSGIFKGTIFRAKAYSDKGRRNYDKPHPIQVHMYEDSDRHTRGGATPAQMEPKLHENGQKPVYAESYIGFRVYAGNEPFAAGGKTLYPEFFASDVVGKLSLLLDYDGESVFCIDDKKRPLTFSDRFDQEVNIGDLVVVAYNYGAGLDLCYIKGYADETRVIIESVETGQADRIPLEDNATAKIMRMPDTIEAMAMMLHLARK